MEARMISSWLEELCRGGGNQGEYLLNQSGLHPQPGRSEVAQQVVKQTSSPGEGIEMME